MNWNDLYTLCKTFAKLTPHGWQLPMWLHNLNIQAGYPGCSHPFYVCQFPEVHHVNG